MPRTSCLGRPSPGALMTWVLVRQTFQSQSVSVWTVGVRFGCTPPGTPSQTGLWTSSPSAVVSPSLGPHSRHGHRLEQVLLEARRWGVWRPPTGCKHPHSRVGSPWLEPPVWRSNRATPPWVGASGQLGGNDPIWWPLPDNCMKVPTGGPLWRNDTGRGPHSDHTLPL